MYGRLSQHDTPRQIRVCASERRAVLWNHRFQHRGLDVTMHLGGGDIQKAAQTAQASEFH